MAGSCCRPSLGGRLTGHSGSLPPTVSLAHVGMVDVVPRAFVCRNRLGRVMTRGPGREHLLERVSEFVTSTAGIDGRRGG